MYAGVQLGEGSWGQGVLVSPQGRALRPRLWHILVVRGKEDSHPSWSCRDTFPPQGEGFGGGWKPAGDFGPLRRGGACPRLSLACSVTGTGGGGPLIRRGCAATPSPQGKALGRLGRSCLAREILACQGRAACSVTGNGGRRTPHPPSLRRPA